jgi:ATP-dependent Clp protease ATP-binding subunit ClpC
MSVYTLSKEAKTVVDTAQQLARQKHHQELDSSHLFYALLKESQAGKEWLDHAARDKASEFLAELDGALSEWYPISSEYSEPSETYLKTMRSAENIAAGLKSESVTSTHILKAVLEQDHRLSEWLSRRVLVPVAVRVTPDTPTLDQVSRDLTHLARENKLAPVIGREKDVQELIEVLLERGKNSALLLGPAGVGKTAIAECLAQEIVSEKVPEKLKNVRLVELNLGTLMAGTTYRGEFEERMDSLLKEIEADRNIILVIDEFHALMNAGKVEHGGPDAVSILKPALARGDITCIGITTDEDFTRFVETDKALVRRFQIIHITEPSPEDTVRILEQISPKYTSHHHVEIPQQTFESIVRWAEQYQPDRHFPDKAIDILGKACARAELQKQALVTPALIAEIMTEMTGVPVGDLDINLRQILVNLENELKQRVIGQESAIKILCQALRLSYTGLRDPNKPKGVFLFLGPSGVGKTEMARVLAEILFGSQTALIRIDMSEYSEHLNVSRLIGSAPGYIGHDEPGQLTQALRNHPHSVVLFDEVEKACPEVFDLFLQLFDEGRLTDSQGHLANGRNAVFIMTSNLGVKSDHREGMGFLGSTAVQNPKSYETEMRAFFRPEFINRIDHIIYFQNLASADLIKIADLEMHQLSQRLHDQKVVLKFEENILPLIVQEAREESGARGINSSIEKLIEIPLSEFLLQDSDGHERSIHVDSDGSNIRLEWI